MNKRPDLQPQFNKHSLAAALPLMGEYMFETKADYSWTFDRRRHFIARLKPSLYLFIYLFRNCTAYHSLIYMF